MNSSSDVIDYVRSNVMTGGDTPSGYLYYQLKKCFTGAEKIDIIVSFLMESGVELILDDLEAAVNRGVKVRLLTGNYLGITQPAALYLIKSRLGDRIDMRFYNDRSRSFHPKSYIFYFRDHSEIFIGSSNVSRSALTSGIEWNFRLTDLDHPEEFEEFTDKFEDLFYNHTVILDDEELKSYSKMWHQPPVIKDLERYESKRTEIPEIRETGDKVVPLFRPRGTQIEALYSLEQSRNDGADRALVHSATGTGKTYIAAFDSLKYDRILFVAHRQEILKQAATSFATLRGSKDIGYFMGNTKETDKKIIFASVETLGKKSFLKPEYFREDAFDYIVIDEFHHAVSKQYRNIISYFKPKFLLGLTATPERMDGRDIYELCNYNVPFELNLGDAINKGMLCPFHYYGIYDETDYSGLRVINGHYTEDDLNKKYIGNQYRYDLIYKHFMKYRSYRTLGFCCSRKHAEDMAKEFSERGIPSVAVYSGEGGIYSENRVTAIKKLKSGKVRAIFSVDMFNEGLDITDVDMVLFLRPTESPVVFLQQLGRGLRLSPGKSHLTVLDFIGNYEKAGIVPKLLSFNKGIGVDRSPYHTFDEYPDNCIVDFDMRLIDLFRKLNEKKTTIADKIDAEITRIKEQLGHIPTRMDLFTEMDEDIYHLCHINSKLNPFRDYLGYLNKREWLNDKEEKLSNSIAKEFLNLIETTNMTKVYKMPILMSFISDEGLKESINDSDILETWKNFFNEGTNWKDFNEKLTYEKYKKISDKEHLKKAHKMPVHFLLESGNGFFVEKSGSALALSDNLRGFLKDSTFVDHFRDIVEFRIMSYYKSRYLQE